MGLTDPEEYSEKEDYALSQQFYLLQKALNELVEQTQRNQDIPTPYSLWCLNLGISNDQSVRLLAEILKILEHDKTPTLDAQRAVLHSVIPMKEPSLSDAVVRNLTEAVRVYYTR